MNNRFEPERIRRTIWFFNAAAQERGLEHKILKNLCKVQFERNRELTKGNWKTKIKLLQDEEAKVSKKGAKRSVGKGKKGGEGIDGKGGKRANGSRIDHMILYKLASTSFMT